MLLVVAGLTLSLVRNVTFDFSLTDSKSLTFALLRVLASLVGFIVIAALMGKSLLQSRLFSKLVLNSTLENARVDMIPPSINDEEKLIDITGSEGVATTDLRPQGKMKADNGQILPVTTMGEFLPRGTRVKVIREEANMLLVRRV